MDQPAASVLMSPGLQNVDHQPHVLRTTFVQTMPDRENMTLDNVRSFLNGNRMSVINRYIDPVVRFSDFVPQEIASELIQHQCKKISPVQAQSWPIISSGANTIIVYRDENNKPTPFTYILPAILHAYHRKSDFPSVAVIVQDQNDIAMIQKQIVDCQSHIQAGRDVIVCTSHGMNLQPLSTISLMIIVNGEWNYFNTIYPYNSSFEEYKTFIYNSVTGDDIIRNHHEQMRSVIKEIGQLVVFARNWQNVESFIDELRIKYMLIEHNIPGAKPNKRHSCGICSYSTDKTSAIKTHMETHSGKKDALCTICNKLFNARVLRAHINNFIKTPAKTGPHASIDVATHKRYFQAIKRNK